WQQVFASTTSVLFVNNTCVASNNFVGGGINFCFNVGSVTSPTIENNVQAGSPGQGNYGTLSGTRTIDYNFYDTLCNLNNCFVYNGSFTGNFANWKTALANPSQPNGAVLGADSHGVQNATPNLGPTGAPLSGSPIIGVGLNLSATATGPL